MPCALCPVLYAPSINSDQFMHEHASDRATPQGGHIASEESLTVGAGEKTRSGSVDRMMDIQYY